jgi:hypothetical protein
MSMIADALTKELLKAVEKTADEGLIEAQLLSQGPISQGVLTEEDHPYAKRHGAPQRDPSIINEHTGDFLRSWDTVFADVYGDSIESGIVNDNPVADYLNQTWGGSRSTMFRRPIKDKVEELVTPKFEKNVQDALDRLGSQDIYL